MNDKAPPTNVEHQKLRVELELLLKERRKANLRRVLFFLMSVAMLWGVFNPDAIIRLQEEEQRAKIQAADEFLSRLFHREKSPTPTPNPLSTPSPTPIPSATPVQTPRPTPQSTPSRTPEALPTSEKPTDLVLLMRVAVSLLVLGASLFVILSKRYGPKDKHWAYATVGTLLGFWLKG
jgi:hypothetical protein